MANISEEDKAAVFANLESLDNIDSLGDYPYLCTIDMMWGVKCYVINWYKDSNGIEQKKESEFTSTELKPEYFFICGVNLTKYKEEFKAIPFPAVKIIHSDIPLNYLRARRFGLNHVQAIYFSIVKAR